MKNLIVSIVAFFFPILAFAAGWTPPQTIPAIPTSTSINDVFLTYNTSTNEVFAVWSNLNSRLPTYSIYHSTQGWSAPAPISTTSAVFDNVYLSYKADSGQVMATWSDLSSFFPTFSIFTPGTGWSAARTISTIPSSTVSENVTTAFQSNTNQVYAVWSELSTNYPIYSIFSNGTWSVPFPITTAATASCDVYLAYDSAADQMIATWGNGLNANVPTYSIFNGFFWGAPGAIAPSSAVYSCVTQLYDPDTQTVFAAWTDSSNNFFPTYSIYQAGNGWSTASTISTTSAVLEDVFMTYDVGGKQVFAAWSDIDNDYHPAYSIYSSNSWSPVAPITTISQALDSVVLTYDSVQGQIFAAWTAFNDYFPTWSLYQSVLPPPPPPPPPPIFPPLPPSHLKGVQRINRFVSQTEYTNLITWKKSSSADIESYQIFRDGLKIAEVGPSVTRFKDPNRKKGRSYVYRIVAVNENGLVSQAVSVKVKGSGK